MALTWKSQTETVSKLMEQLVFSDQDGQTVTVDDGFCALNAMSQSVRDDNKTVYAIGNGASASLASHFTADLAKNGRLHTQVFSDLALITAISNDLSFSEVFAEPLRRRGRKGDVLVAISSSGRSDNILKAVAVAQELGITVVTLSAMKPDNPLRRRGHLNGYVPAETYGTAETVHAAILHFWIDYVVENQSE